jgi:hypothetical protein
VASAHSKLFAFKAEQNGTRKAMFMTTSSGREVVGAWMSFVVHVPDLTGLPPCQLHVGYLDSHIHYHLSSATIEVDGRRLPRADAKTNEHGLILVNPQHPYAIQSMHDTGVILKGPGVHNITFVVDAETRSGAYGFGVTGLYC